MGAFTYACPHGLRSSSVTPSALVPPPRDTSGIPVSEDAPEDARVPMPASLALLAFVAAAMRRRG